MRKINGRLFLALLLGAAVLGGGTFLIHRFQLPRIGQALLWQARRAEEQGQTGRQVTYLQRYLEFNPRDDAEKVTLARVWSGEAYSTSLKARNGAVRLLDEALRANNVPEQRRLLVKTALEVRDLSMARGHLVQLMPEADVRKRLAELRGARKRGENLPADLAKEDAETGELEGFWGQLFEAENKPADALDCLRLAFAHAPGRHADAARLAFLLRRHPEADPAARAADAREADGVIKEMVRRSPESVDALLTRWRYRRTFDLLDIRESGSGHKGQLPLETAAEDVAKALTLNETRDGVDVLLAAADLERLRGRIALEDRDGPAARRWEAQGKHRALAEGHLTRGLALIERKGQGAGTDVPRFQLLWHKANLLLDDLDRVNNPDAPEADPAAVAAIKAEVNALIAQVRKTTVAAAGEYLQGRLLVHEQSWSEAAKLFERAQKLLAPQPDLAAQADLYLGQCYGRMGEGKQMYEAYRRVLDRDPTSVAAPLGMATALTLQNRFKEARQQYEELRKAGRLPARGLFDVAHLEVQWQAQQEKPDWAAADRAVDRAEKANRGEMTAVALLRAELMVRQNKLTEAKEVLRLGASARRKDTDYYAALCDLALRERKFDEARQVLAEAEKEAGDRAALRLARARVLIAETDKSKADAVKALVASLKGLTEGCEKFGEDDQAALLKGVAQGLMAAGADADARALWQRVAAMPRQKGDLGLRLLLFDLALKAGDEAGVDACLEDIKAAEQTSGAFHHYGKALRLIWLGRKETGARQSALLADARLELDQVQTQRPSWSPIFLARAEIDRMTSARGQEIAHLQQALEYGEEGPVVVQRLVELLRQDHKNEQAGLVLEQHAKAVKANMELARIQVGIFLARKESAKALAAARELVRDDSKDPEDLLLLADALHADRKDAEAEAKYDAAIRHGGSGAKPWLKKVQFLIDVRRAADAEAVLEPMRAALGAETAEVAEGDCRMLMRQWDKAEAAYEKALAARRDDPRVVRQMAGFYSLAERLDKAEGLLREMTGEASKSGPADRAWARRELADVLSRRGLPKDREEALSLVGLKVDADGRAVAADGVPDDNVESRRARARVLARQPGRKLRGKAVELLEALRADRALDEDDQHRLAQLYRVAAAEAGERPAKARKEYEDLLSRPRLKPQYLADYVALLLTDTRAPGKLSEGERAEARKALDRLKELESQFGTSPDAFGRVEMEARLLESGGEGDKALVLLRKHAARKSAGPDAMLLLLASLSRQKKTDDAFALLETGWKDGKVKPEVLGGASLSLVGLLTDAQTAAVEKHLKVASKADGKNLALRMQLADLYGKRKQFDEAEAAYRGVLEVDPKHPVALNNLAWLLATRSGDANEALEFITKAVDGMGRRVELLDTRGVVYLALKDPEKALSDLKEATAEAPTPSRLFHLGQAHHLNKDGARAKQVLKEAYAKGLRPERCHPTEQTTCEQLLAEYNVR